LELLSVAKEKNREVRETEVADRKEKFFLRRIKGLLFGFNEKS